MLNHVSAISSFKEIWSSSLSAHRFFYNFLTFCLVKIIMKIMRSYGSSVLNSNFMWKGIFFFNKTFFIVNQTVKALNLFMASFYFKVPLLIFQSVTKDSVIANRAVQLVRAKYVCKLQTHLFNDDTSIWVTVPSSKRKFEIERTFKTMWKCACPGPRLRYTFISFFYAPYQNCRVMSGLIPLLRCVMHFWSFTNSDTSIFMLHSYSKWHSYLSDDTRWNIPQK